MKLPNSQKAIIAPSKLREYVLNIKHKRGGSKAHVLERCGYLPENWEDLDAEIRRHLGNDVDVYRMSDYGDRFEIRMQLATPVGRLLNLRTVWQIDDGTDFPRLITLYPD